MIFFSAFRFSPFIVLMTVMSGCLLQQPENDFHPEVKPTQFSASNINLKINLNEVNVGDTIYVPALTKLSYAIDPGVYTGVSASVTLNNQNLNVFGSAVNEWSFYIDPTYHQKGNFNLVINLTMKTNSGSLADKLEVEQIKAQKTFIVAIGPLPTLNITQMESSSGVLVIHWETYKRKNFESYTLLKYPMGEYTPSLQKKFTSSETSSYVDSTFVGGSATYIIALNASSITQYGTQYFYTWNPRFEFEGSNTETKYRWEKPRFYKVTTGYIINGANLSLTDTSYTGPPIKYLNSPNYVPLRFKTKDGSSVVINPWVFKGKKADPPSLLPTAYNPKDNLYYGNRSAPDKTVVMNDEMSPSVSLDQKFLFAISLDANSMVICDKTKIWNVDPKTLSTNGSFDTKETCLRTQMANNGSVLVQTNSEDLIIWLPQLINRYQFPYSNNFFMSTSGQYYIYNNKIYKYFGRDGYYDYVDVMGQLPSTTIYTFFDKNDNVISLTGDGNIGVYEPATGTVIKSYSFGSSLAGAYFDVHSGLLLLNGQYIFDPSTGLKKQVSEQTSNMTLLNGKLFWPMTTEYGSPTDSFVFIDVGPL